MITRDTIQTIIESSKIEEVVGDFVRLQRRGHNFQGLCPFHNEKTPSFVVSPIKGIYKCFGCGKSGNAVNFIMAHENLSYPDALRWLARKYNIEIKEENLSKEALEVQSERETLFAVNTFAQKRFSDNLFETDEGKSVGLSYFRSRGLSDDIIQKFNLGYSLEEWDSFTKAAVGEGFGLEYLEKTGLTTTTNGRHYDKFRGRVVFPIHNISGRVIGFGGRTLSNDKKMAKYLNSPESEIYHKSNSLYGIYLAKHSITDKDNCYLVEGYFDVISMFNAGIQNVVASSGTSLTVEQVRMIRRYTKNVTILYDGDSAGIKASFRGIDMILKEGLNVSALLFPDGDDPDSFVRKSQPDDVVAYLKANAKDFITFKTEILLDDIKDNPFKRAELIKEIVSSIALVPDQISRSEFIKKCSSTLNIEEGLVGRELDKQMRQGQSNDSVVVDVKEERLCVEPEIQKQFNLELDHEAAKEREIVRLLLNYGNRMVELSNEDDETVELPLFHFVVSSIEEDDLTLKNKLYNSVYQAYKECVINGTNIDHTHFTNSPDGNVSSFAADMIADAHVLSPKWEEKHKIFTKTEDDNITQTVNNAIILFKLSKIEEMCKNLTEELKNAMSDEDSLIILHRLSQMSEIRKRPASHLGRVILRIL